MIVVQLLKSTAGKSVSELMTIAPPPFGRGEERAPPPADDADDADDAS